MASRLATKKHASQPPKSISHGYGVYHYMTRKY